MSGSREPGPEIERHLFHAFPSATTRQDDGWTVMPSSTDDAARAVGIANLCGCPVLVAARGGDERTGPRPSMLRLSLERLTGVLRVTEPAMTAEVQSGIAMRNLEIVLNDHGLTTGAVLLPDADPTLIDFVTDDSFSEASILYGRTDQICLGAEGVLPSGEVFRIKPAPVRAAGPDILGLLVAGHGSVSIVTALILRLWRLPKSRRVVPAGFGSGRLEDALTTASTAARVPIRLAAGRIYAPGWSDQAPGGGDAAHGPVAVFILEGEQAVVEATAVHLEGIVQACGGTLLSPQHTLATRFVRAPRVAGGEATVSISATAPWPSVFRIHRDVAGRLGDALLASRFSDFFHEGCRVTWTLREVDLGRESLVRVVETLRGLGGRLTSRHPALEGDLPPHPLDDAALRLRMEEMKRSMDPGGILGG